jgi:hypothetical protein
MTQDLMGMKWTLVTGVLLGAILSPIGPELLKYAYQRYDATHPVVTMTGEAKEVGEFGAIVELSGIRLRGGCEYVRLLAYTADPRGVLHDAQIRRIDFPETAVSRPPNHPMDFGRWSIHPLVPGAVKAIIYAQHTCGGRLVSTKATEILLPVVK